MPAFTTLSSGDLAMINSLTNVTFSTTPTFNAALSRHQEITLTNNVTSSTITNPQTGLELIITLIQDATGGRTFTWPANVKLAGGTVTLSGATKRDTLTLRYNGTNWYEIARSLNM